MPDCWLKFPDLLLCFTSRHHRLTNTASSGLPESCLKDGGVPKFPCSFNWQPSSHLRPDAKAMPAPRRQRRPSRRRLDRQANPPGRPHQLPSLRSRLWPQPTPYDLRKLKGHGLVERHGSRYAYRLTAKGVQVALLFLFFHKRLCGPLANSHFHHRPDTVQTASSKPPATAPTRPSKTSSMCSLPRDIAVPMSNYSCL
jgi:hypothetical protein